MWLSTLIGSISLIIISIIISFNKYKMKELEMELNEKKIEYEENKFYSELDLTKLQLEFQDQLNICMEEYCLLYINHEEDLYITDELQNIMVDEVYGRMIDRISKPLETKIKLYRNIPNDIEFKRYVRYEVSIAVMGKVLEIDKTKQGIPDPKSLDPTADDILSSLYGEERANF